MGVKLTPVVRPHGVSQAGSGVSIVLRDYTILFFKHEASISIQ